MMTLYSQNPDTLIVRKSTGQIRQLILGKYEKVSDQVGDTIYLFNEEIVSKDYFYFKKSYQDTLKTYMKNKYCVTYLDGTIYEEGIWDGTKFVGKYFLHENGNIVEYGNRDIYGLWVGVWFRKFGSKYFIYYYGFGRKYGKRIKTTKENFYHYYHLFRNNQEPLDTKGFNDIKIDYLGGGR